MDPLSFKFDPCRYSPGSADWLQHSDHFEHVNQDCGSDENHPCIHNLDYDWNPDCLIRDELDFCQTGYGLPDLDYGSVPGYEEDFESASESETSSRSTELYYHGSYRLLDFEISELELRHSEGLLYLLREELYLYNAYPF